MRRTSRARAGEGGGKGGFGGDGPRPGSVWRNDTFRDATDVAPKDFASVRSTPGAATNMAGPSGQQFVKETLRRASDEPCDDAFAAAVAADSVNTGET
jgi:hypothetical protein